MSELPELEDVDLGNGIVVLQGGVMLPIVRYLDEDGDDCEPADAAGVVAGTPEYGFLSIDLLEPETIH